MSRSARSMALAAGPVMVIGGAEDKLRHKAILSRFARFAGGADGHVVVVSTASSLGEEATGRYRELLEGLGIARVSGLRPEERAEANAPEVAKLLADATGVFLTGGNQSRLTQVVGGTRLADALLLAHDRGAVLAGTSAGASAMASHMVAYGRSGPTPKHRMVQLSAGLGVIQNVVIDQHFEQRSRVGRLLALVAQSPALLGIGVDEDTCAIVHPDRTLEVVGKGAVTIVDGSHIKTDAFRGKGYRPLMVSGAVLHSLPAGYWFDLRGRTLLAEPRALEQREASE
ncbi:MAG TPA: cyanophycinase [Actinomycetota bacterium]|nr:cyanophycinase [Actinomycetota bacterium]